MGRWIGLERVVVCTGSRTHRVCSMRAAEVHCCGPLTVMQCPPLLARMWNACSQSSLRGKKQFGEAVVKRVETLRGSHHSLNASPR